MANFFYIIGSKIKDGVIKFKNKAQELLRSFFEKAHNFLKRVSEKYWERKGCVYKGQTHCYTKKDGQYREGSDVIHLDQEMGEYYRTTITKKVSEEEVPPLYREIKNDETIDNTEEIDAILSF